MRTVLSPSPVLALVSLLLRNAVAECPNACSGNGECGRHDVCSCYNGYQANDCSERTCYFGIAHVDTPKGDLNGDGVVSGPLTTVLTGSEIYPWGTNEQYPNADANEGHFYMECSNRGLCNRADGLCECFDGYEGSACNRKSCPQDCSGHGTCESIRELAEHKGFDTRAQHTSAQQPVSYESDNLSIEESYAYNLWDADISQGCQCDPSYFGADCSLRKCRYGTDPLFFDKDQNTIVQTAVVHLGSKGANAGAIGGMFSIVFYDAFGEAFTTKPIEAQRTTTTADKVRFALEALPGGIIHRTTMDTTTTPPPAVDVSMACNAEVSGCGEIEESGQVGAGKMGSSSGAGLGTRGGKSAYGPEFTITFSTNPGLLKSIEIDTRQVTNPGTTDYWTAQQRVGQFQTRYTTMIDRAQTLMYGSKLLYTANDISGWAPTNNMIKIGRQEFNIDSINYYQATLSEPYLGPSIVPSKIAVGNQGAAITVSAITDADGNGKYDLLTFAPAVSSTAQLNSLLSGHQLMVGDCPMMSADWNVEIGDTTLAIEETHDCHPDTISGTLADGTTAVDATLYRTEGDPDQQDIFIAEADTYETTSGLATTRGSPFVYPVSLCTSLVTAYDVANTKFTLSAAAGAADAAVLTLWSKIFVNGIGPFTITTAVSDTATEILTALDEAKLLLEDADVSGVSWRIWVVQSEASQLVAGSVFGMYGRKYKVATNGGAHILNDGSTFGTKYELTEAVAGGQLVKICDYCVTDVASGGNSITTSKKVTLKAGEQVLVGGFLNEDHLISVTADTYTETCTSPDGLGSCEGVTLDGVAATCTSQTDGDGTACVHWTATSSTTIATSPGCYRGTCGGDGTAVGVVTGLAGLNRKHLYKVAQSIGYQGSKVVEATAGVTYQYVSQCANRGSCDTSTGLCECYRGYSGLTCSSQNMLAL